MSALKENDTVGKYLVQSLIKENEYTETYRVQDENDTPFFLKLYILKKTPERLVNLDTNEVFAIERCKNLVHNNIVPFITSGKIVLDCGECHYLITNYFTGDVLLDRILRDGPLPEGQALEIFNGILQGLKYLHDNNLCHNDITPRNIMLSKVAGGIPEIIDMGHTAPRCNGKLPFDVSDLEVLYCANETSMGIYDEQSDVFSAVAVLYTMLAGEAPWTMEFATSMSRNRRFTLLRDKRKSEELNLEALNVSELTRKILRKGLAVKYENRYRCVDDILKALSGEDTTQSAEDDSKQHQFRQNIQQEDAGGVSSFVISKGKGHGFEDIAGMAELKNMLNQKVIFVLKNKELAEKYRLLPPNGMLLYGPPGCGKTFFAEKFAEETGFNYLMVKSSDLASVYVHGSQQKIGSLFDQAVKKAPVVLCFDEFDALVPDRSHVDNPSMSGEVNEFLSQLNNCSKKGIFVIATSNRPDKIDPAVLRTGRIDKQVYVPLPDKDARRQMFAIHLKGRPYHADKIDFDRLAVLSEGYIASDIAYIVNDAAMTAAFVGKDISQDLLETSLKNTRPSIHGEVLKMYDELQERMTGIERNNLTRRPIGFHVQ